MVKRILVFALVVPFLTFLIPIQSFADSYRVKLANGTPVILRLTEEVSSRTKNISETINLEVARDVVVDGKIVIKSGTPAIGTVTMLEQKGMVGKAGKIQISLEATKSIDGQRISLRSFLTQGGKDSQATALAGGVICCPLFLLMKGKEATIAAGTEVKAYTETDMTIDVE